MSDGRVTRQTNATRATAAASVLPALNAAEWAKLERCAPGHNAFAVRQPAGTVELRISASDRQVDVKDAAEFAAIIALANVALADGDSRKLTRVHVKVLRRVADENEVIPWGAEAKAIALLRQLADVIESYLPPA